MGRSKPKPADPQRVMDFDAIERDAESRERFCQVRGAIRAWQEVRLRQNRLTLTAEECNPRSVSDRRHEVLVHRQLYDHATRFESARGVLGSPGNEDSYGELCRMRRAGGYWWSARMYWDGLPDDEPLPGHIRPLNPDVGFITLDGGDLPGTRVPLSRVRWVNGPGRFIGDEFEFEYVRAGRPEFRLQVSDPTDPVEPFPVTRTIGTYYLDLFVQESRVPNSPLAPMYTWCGRHLHSREEG